jgi:hypothetical protein
LCTAVCVVSSDHAVYRQRRVQRRRPRGRPTTEITGAAEDKRTVATLTYYLEAFCSEEKGERKKKKAKSTKKKWF